MVVAQIAMVPPMLAWGAGVPNLAIAATTASSEHAVLRARIDPNGTPTTYSFEYGLTEAYGTSLPVNATGADSKWHRVTQRVENLQPRTTYHYRLRASNQDGATTSADRLLVTGPGLPEQRVYELVSPPNKLGNDITADTGRTRVAADGSAIQFTSLGGGFGDARGTGYSTEFIAQRTATNWTTHGITPLQTAQDLSSLLSAGFDPRYVGEFSEDLTTGVFTSNRLLTSEGSNVQSVKNLYVRRDLRTRGSGEYKLVSDAAEAMAGPVSYKPLYAESSANFEHVVFSSTLNLTGQTNGTAPKLYEWLSSGGVRLAGILPDDECAALGEPSGCPAPRAIAGRGFSPQAYTTNTVSSDGERIVFTVGTSNGAFEGALYVREHGSQTLRVNASEKAIPESPQPATYWDASADGSKVFFTSSEELTETPGSGLYQWSASKAEGERLTLVSVDNEPSDPDNLVEGVAGVSADGDTAYFIGASQLVSGAPPRPDTGEELLFVWHEGTLAFVGNVNFTDTNNLLGRAGMTLTPKLARVTPDGQHFLFAATSQVGLTGHDSGECGGNVDECREMYLYRIEDPGGAGELVCLSCPDVVASGTTASIYVRDGASNSGPGAAMARAIAEDGQHVFFHTARGLVERDQNGLIDAYMYDVANGQLHILSSGRSDDHSYFVGASSDGDDVFILTREPLVLSDGDGNYDIYDVRVNGGITEDGVRPICSGDRCRGTLPGGTARVTPGSTSVKSSRVVRRGKAAVFHVARLRKSRMRRLAAGLSVPLIVRVSEAGRITARIYAQGSSPGRPLAQTSRVAAHGGSIRMRLKLSAKAVRSIRTSKKVRAVLSVSYGPTRGRQQQRVVLIARSSRAGS